MELLIEGFWQSHWKFSKTIFIILSLVACRYRPFQTIDSQKYFKVW